MNDPDAERTRAWAATIDSPWPITRVTLSPVADPAVDDVGGLQPDELAAHVADPARPDVAARQLDPGPRADPDGARRCDRERSCRVDGHGI